MSAVGECVRTLGDALRGYDLPDGAREAIEAVIAALKVPSSGGPWFLDADRGEVLNDNGEIVARIGHTMGGAAGDWANGRLIAAAPDLYAACREVVSMPLTQYHGDAVTKRCYIVPDAVIAKVWAAIQKVDASSVTVTDVPDYLALLAIARRMATKLRALAVTAAELDRELRAAGIRDAESGEE